MLRRITMLALAVTCCIGSTTSADAAPRKFKNCTKLRLVHPHGVAKSRAAARRATGLTGPPKISRALYLRNKGLDRDHDGVACER